MIPSDSTKELASPERSGIGGPTKLWLCGCTAVRCGFFEVQDDGNIHIISYNHMDKYSIYIYIYTYT